MVVLGEQPLDLGPIQRLVLRRRAHYLVKWGKDSAVRLGPHLNLVRTILVLDVLAVSAAGIVYGLTTNLAVTFGEFGPIQTLKAGHLLVSGVSGYLIYTRFWRLPQAGQRVDAPGSFYWILSGAGLVWLSIDDYVQIHERLGDVLEEDLGITIPLLNNPDDIIVLGYAVAALIVIAIFFGELRRSRTVFPLLATGLGFLVVSLAVDFFAPHGTVLTGLEEPTNIVGAGFVLSAYLVKLREVSGEVTQPIVTGRPSVS